MADKIEKYTNQHVAGFGFGSASQLGADVVAIVISGAAMPMVFTATGNYESGGKQKNPFQQGTVYFRHGAKSEPVQATISAPHWSVRSAASGVRGWTAYTRS